MQDIFLFFTCYFDRLLGFPAVVTNKYTNSKRNLLQRVKKCFTLHTYLLSVNNSSNQKRKSYLPPII